MKRTLISFYFNAPPLAKPLLDIAISKACKSVGMEIEISNHSFYFPDFSKIEEFINQVNKELADTPLAKYQFLFNLANYIDFDYMNKINHQ